MKTQKIITIITIILVVVLLIVVSIFGIYKLKDYRVKNIIPEYILGMEFTDNRIINLEVDQSEVDTIYDKDGKQIIEKEEGIEYTEENGYKIEKSKINKDEILTKENFDISKRILKERLKGFGVDQYKVILDKSNGNIQVRIPENNYADLVINNMLKDGTFELKDSETGDTLIDTTGVKKSNVVYSQTESGTGVYLQIKLTKEGKQKLEEISKVYVEKIVQTENEEEETTETKNVDICLNGEIITQTYFGEPATLGILNIPIGSANDSVTLMKYEETARQYETILNSGMLPIIYTETNYIQIADTAKQQTYIIAYVLLGIIALMTLIFIIRFRKKGILSSMLQIGYIALLLITLRYTNVKITFEGICGILLGMIMNFLYIYISFKNMNLSFIKDVTAKFALKLIPVYIIAVILSFNSIANVYSLGMTLVWGIIVMYIYNLILTQMTIKTIKK